MTDQHRATTEQDRADPRAWENVGVEYLRGSSAAACLLELRARVEALEATQHTHADLSHLTDAEREQVMRTAGFAYAESAEQRHVTPEAKPAPSLDQMIIDAMLAAHVKGGGTSFPVPHPDEIQAAIRAVAAWLRTGRLLHAADLLEQEADRG
jgi:hypothetical protein